MIILKSEDLLPVESNISIKSIVKSFLQRIGFYKSIHGPARVRSFFLTIYVERQAFKQVLFKLEISKSFTGCFFCYVNGHKVKLEYLVKNYYLASAEGFYAYENVISFPHEMAVKRVDIFPVVESENLNENQILTRHYTLVKLENGIERFICRRSIDLKKKIIKKH